MTTSRFDDLSDVYEAMIDWPKRLAAEEAFFRPLFQQVKARRIADVACGTGHQAAMFHSWGLEVDASDLSPRMIQQACDSFGSPDGLTWTERGFGQPLPADQPYDVVTCLGNSLALAGDLTQVEQAVAAMLGPFRPYRVRNPLGSNARTCPKIRSSMGGSSFFGWSPVASALSEDLAS